MGRDFVRHQQPVSAAHGQRRLALIVAAVAAVGIALVLFTMACIHGQDANDSMGEGDGAKEYAQELAGVSVRESSVDSFLDDLESMPPVSSVDAGHARACAVVVHAKSDLPDLAGDVMRAYGRADACSFVCGGYLDLKGNKWGSVFRCEGAWVDVVYVTAAEDGADSTARIVRLTPEGARERSS